MSGALPGSTSTPLEVAQFFRAAGVSVIKVRADGTKAAAHAWAPFTGRIASLEECQDWWGNGHPYGIAAICGEVSGNLELVEVEGVAATDPVFMDRLYDALIEHDVHGTWNILNRGFMQQSPTGGLHLVYRLDCPPPGNEKIARRPATEAELAQRPGNKLRVLIETRGEGGYFILAGSPLGTHPTGKPWTVISGGPDSIPVITWAEREALHAALRTLDEEPVRSVPPPQLPVPKTSTVMNSTGLSPGDDFENRTDWSEILDGWTMVHQSPNGGREWCRPGKNPRDGISATTGQSPTRDRLYVFSTSTDFQSEVPYTKFGALALLHYGGDHSAAASALARQGYGDRLARVDTDEMMGTKSVSREVAIVGETVTEPEGDFHTHDDTGNGMRLQEKTKGRFHWVDKVDSWFHWTGQRWEDDYSGALTREMISVTDRMRKQAKADEDIAMTKWASKSRSLGALKSAQGVLRTLPGMTRLMSDFDTHMDLLNVGNGILNLKTNELMPHAPEYLMTRTFGADYDPKATCPKFEQFMADVLPDERMRAYVQRAIGYSLLGRVDQRAMFLVYGPSGTGKSTLMDVMRRVFGDYGTTAASGTFRAKREGQVTNDLHGLRGKRFVTTSETAETASFDEDTIKRLTGRDQIQSRELYQKNQEWTPECAIWLATNHPPKFNSDDDAIWRRAKLIPFLTQFSGDTEIPDMARTHLAPEAAGILNWILAGLADYLANGLGEPAEVKEAAAEQRAASDPVARFIEDRIDGGSLTLGGHELRIRTSELHQMYVAWARESGERPLGIRRFGNRLAAGSVRGIGSVKLGGQMHWEGIGRVPGSGIMGTM